MKLRNNKIAILGLGKTGISTYDYLYKQKVDVCIWDDNKNVMDDSKGCSFNFKSYEDWDFENLDFIVASPGINLRYPSEHFVYQKAKEYGVKIICDIELFFNFFPNKKYIGVSGTNGKSTTVSLIKHIFLENNVKVALAGNIGIPVFDLEVDSCDFIILELSSYQLELIESLKLSCAMLLNIKPDHIEHHGSFINYIEAKKRIFLNQNLEDRAIVYGEYDANNLQNRLNIYHKNSNDKGIAYVDNKLVDNYFEENLTVLDFSDLDYLKGEHNQQNVAFAYACTRNFALSLDGVIAAIKTFKGLDHRQSFVRKIDDIVFINDSKATNCESTEQALKVFSNIYLILGGLNKVDNLDVILPFFTNVIHTFLIGNSEDLYANILEDENIPFTKVNNLENAVHAAFKMAKHNSDVKEKTVLLSPACSSFDQFKSFEHRGEIFKKLVLDL